MSLAESLKSPASRKISYAPFSEQYKDEKEKISEIVKNIFESGMFVGGPSIKKLEEEIAAYCNVKYCVALNSGTDALILGMKALGISAGDEVITPPNSFIASTAAIVHVGATPVFVDVDADQNMDVTQIEACITSKTKAIMPIHLTGRICNMTAIKEIADCFGLFIIEDAAQSFGSKYHDKLSGSFGDVGCFSAHPLKVLNACGDAGFMTTNRADVFEKSVRLRSHGLLDRNTVKEWGYVSRMDTLQAEILRLRLKNIQQVIEKRRSNVALYRELLNKDFVFIPDCKQGEFNTFQTFVIQVNHRDELKNFLNTNGIECSIHYPIPIHLQEAAKDLGYKEGDFPRTETQSKNILSIPAHHYLEDEDIKYVSHLINFFYEEKIHKS